MNAGDHIICISTMKIRPATSLQRTSTMLFFFNGVSGKSSAGRYSTLTIFSSSVSKGSRALRRLITRSGCSPNTFLKVKSALGSRYFIIRKCCFYKNSAKRMKYKTKGGRFMLLRPIIIMTLHCKPFKRLISTTEIKIKSREHNSSVFKIWEIQFGILHLILL